MMDVCLSLGFIRIRVQIQKKKSRNIIEEMLVHLSYMNCKASWVPVAVKPIYGAYEHTRMYIHEIINDQEAIDQFRMN